MNQTMKNIITGQDMNYGEFEYDWQQFIFNRQDEKTTSGEYLKAENDLEKLLQQIGDKGLADKIRDTAIDMECVSKYESYSQGLFDGIKLALILKGKNLNI